MFVFFRRVCFFVSILYLIFFKIIFSAEKLGEIKNKEFFIKKNIKNTLDDFKIILGDDFIENEQPKSTSLIDNATNVVVSFPVDFLVEGIPVLDKEFLFSQLHRSLIKVGLSNFVFPLFGYRYFNNKNDYFSYLIYVFFDFSNKEISKGLNNCDRKIVINTEHLLFDQFLTKLQFINKRKYFCKAFYKSYKAHRLIDLLNFNISFEEKSLGNFDALLNYQFAHLDKNFFENLLLLDNRFVLSFKRNKHINFDNKVICDFINSTNQVTNRIAFLSKLDIDYFVLVFKNVFFSKVGVSLSYQKKNYNKIFHYFCPFFKFEFKLNEKYKIYLYCLDRQIKCTSLDKVVKRTNIINRQVLLPFENFFDLINIGLIFDYFFYTVKLGGKYIYVNNSFYYVAKYSERESTSPYETGVSVGNKYFPQFYLCFEHWDMKKKMCINFNFDIKFHFLSEKKIFSYKMFPEFVGSSALKYKYDKFLFYISLFSSFNSLYLKQIADKELTEFVFDKFILKIKNGFDYFLKEDFCVFLNYEIQLNRSELELNSDLNKLGKLSVGINYFL